MKASELANQAIEDYEQEYYKTHTPPTKLYISAKLWRELTEEVMSTHQIFVSKTKLVRSYKGLTVRRILEDGECFVK